MSNTVKSEIEKTIAENEITLFMKGTKNAPRCGFSATVVQILDELITDYHTVDVLENPEIS